MGFKLSCENFNNILNEFKKDYIIYAPIRLEGKGSFSDTDIIRYGEINSIEDIVMDVKSNFSFKEILNPITQTLFYFTEDNWIEPKVEQKNFIIFLRSCDMHAVKRLDEVYLNNGAKDPYYKKLRDKTKFIVMGCDKSFENCFCVSMGTNKTDEYDGYINIKDNMVYLDVKNLDLQECVENAEVEREFASENDIIVNIPENLDLNIIKSDVWNEYSKRCIACGRCNFVCPTCTCFTMQDIFYKDNPNSGERRRVWASCQVDGYTDMAGGHGFRKDKGQRMRFKVMHKVYDYKKRFGYHMCVGCGRCDDICPEYISFSNCINKLGEAMKEGKNE